MISNPATVRSDRGAATTAAACFWTRLGRRTSRALRGVALLPVLVLLIVVGTLVSPAFFTVANFAGIGEQSSALGVVVVGESLILMIGGMDLALESPFG